MARQTIEQWINEVVLDKDKEGACTAIALVHVRGNIEQEIHAVKGLNAGQIDTGDLAKLFRNKADNYADEIPGVQTFKLLAFYGNRGEPQAFKPFMVRGYIEHEGLGTESPTATGFLQQAMRHLEAKEQIGARERMHLFDRMSSLLDTVTTRFVSVAHENREMFEMTKQLLMERADKTHEHRLKELEVETNSELKRQLVKVAPALINGVTGREVFPQSTADTSLVEGMIDALAANPDSDAAVAAFDALKLPPQLMGSLAARFAQGMKERREQMKLRKLANGADHSEEDLGVIQ